MTSFVIGPGGKVIKVTAAGLNRAVATCVERVVKQMRFPKPRGAGVVKVRFPTNFTPVGPVKRKP